MFLAILVDLFPGVKVPTDDYGDLMVAIKSEIADRGLQENDKMCSKIIQLHDMVKIRFGVTIVGPTGGGKYLSEESECNRVYGSTVVIVIVIFYDLVVLLMFCMESHLSNKPTQCILKKSD